METEQKPDFEAIAKDMMRSNEDELDSDTETVNPNVLERLEIRFYKAGMEKIWNDYHIPIQKENKRLKENYDHSQRVLDSYRKLLEEAKKEN